MPFTMPAAPQCPVCNKGVYKMEEIVALGSTWHKLCFRCAALAPEDPSGSETRCGKKLDLTNYAERKPAEEGGHPIPYCKSCYNKNFGFTRVGAAI